MDTRTVIQVSDVTYIQRQDFPFLIKSKILMYTRNTL